MLFRRKKVKQKKERAADWEEEIKKSREIDFNRKTNQLYIAKCEITSSNHGKNKPTSVDWYFLAYKKDGKYYNAETDKELQFEPRNKYEAALFLYYDTPWIKEIKPLSRYIKAPDIVDIRDIYEFVVNMNVNYSLSKFYN